MEDNGDELAERVETRCGHRGSLLRERRETLCPLEADRDQVGPVGLCEVEGMSAADGCTRSLEGMKAPGALVETRVPVVIVPSTSVVPVCVVSTCVYTSVAKCVLRRTHSGSARACVRATPCVDGTPSETPSASETPCASGGFTSVPECVLPGTPCVKGAPQGEETTCAREAARVCEPPCVNETPRVSAPAGVGRVVCVSEARVSERPCGRVTACVRSLCVREMTVAMHEHAAASPGVNGSLIECSLGVVTRRCAWREWRRRLRLWRDKGRVAAVVAMGTVPGLHGSERVVRAVPRTRPPRARLRE